MNPEKFWLTLNPGTPLPALPNDPLGALEALFKASNDGDYFCVGFNREADAWPRIALGVAQDHWQGQLAMQLTGLVNVGGNYSGDAWYIDTQADAGGEYRVYWYFHDTLDTMPVCRGIDAFLEYLALLRTDEITESPEAEFLAESHKIPGVYKGEEDPDWDETGDDGWEAFAEMYEHEFQDVYVMYARGCWPEERFEPEPPASTTRRTWMSAMMDVFVERKQVVYPPDMDLDALSPVERRYVEELEAFLEAMEAGAIPPLVKKHINDPDPILTKAADGWLAEFEAHRAR